MGKRFLSAFLIVLTLMAYMTFEVHAAAPTVKTAWYEDLTKTTVTWVGELQLNGGENVTDVGFVYGTTSSNLSTKKSYGYMGDTKGSYRVYVTGLKPKTKYYFQAYAVNKDGKSYGSISEILTPAVPDITTVSVTNITATSATLNGNLTANNGLSVTDCGFDYGIGTTLNKIISYGNMGTSKGTITRTITGLQPNTTYSYRAYATNDAGEGIGVTKTFKTEKATLSVPTVYGFASGLQDKGSLVAKWYSVKNATGYKISLRDLTTDTLKFSNTSLSSGTLSYNLSTYLDYNHKYRFAVTGTNSNYEEAWTEKEFDTKPDTPTVKNMSSRFSCFQGDTVTLNGTLSGNTNITKVTINVQNESDVIVSQTLNSASVNLNQYSINTSQGVFSSKTGTYTINIWATSVGQPTGVLAGSTKLEVKTSILSAPIVTNLSENMEIEKGAFTANWNAVPNATSYLVSLRDTTTDTSKISNLSVSGTSYTIASSSFEYGHSYRFAITAVRTGFDSEWTEINFKVKPDIPRLSGLSSQFTAIQGQSFYLNGGVTANTNINKITIGIEGLSDSFISFTPNTTSYSLSNVLFNTSNGVLSGRYGTYTVNVWAACAGYPSGVKIGTFTLRIKNIQLDAPRFTNISNNTTVDKGNFTVNWASVTDATGYTLTLRNTTTGSTVFTKSVTGTSNLITSDYLERGGKYQLTLTANASGRTSSSVSVNFSVSLSGVVVDSEVVKVAPNIFEFTLTSDYHAPRVVTQFKLSDGSWMTINDVLSDGKFLLDYQGKNNSGAYTYSKKFSITSAGNRTLRFLLLDEDNNVIYTETQQHNISVDSIMTVTKSGNNDVGYVHISYADSSISSVKIFINGTEVDHYSRTNGQFEDYVIDKHQYDDGVYTIDVWGCEYQTYRVLSVASPETFTVDNPVVITDIQPVKLSKTEKRIHIKGTNLNRVSLSLYVNDNPASNIFGSGANNLTIIQQNSYTDIIAEIPAVFDSANQEYKIDVKATYRGKEWTHPFWIEKRTPDPVINPDATEGAEAAYKRMLQLHDFKWTPLKNVRGWRGNKTYYANTTYTGIPYGQPINANGGYVGHTISFAKYRTDMANVNSNFYKDYKGTQICPAYSSDCSAALSYAWGRSRITTVDIAKLADQGTYTRIGTDANKVRAGDAINNRQNHVFMVYRVVRNSDGGINRIYTIEESASSNMIKRSYTVAQLQSRMNGNVDGFPYEIIRNPNLNKVTYTADPNAPINYDPPVNTYALGLSSFEDDIIPFEEFVEPEDIDFGDQDIPVEANIDSISVSKENNTISIDFDREIVQLFEERFDRIKLVKNEDTEVSLQEDDYVSFSGETLNIFLKDTEFLSDCNNLQVKFDIIIVAFADGYNNSEFESELCNIPSDDVSELPLTTGEFQYSGVVKESNSVKLLFNKPIQNANTSSIRVLNAANVDITTQYPIKSVTAGNEIKISFTTPPTTDFKLKMLANSITAIGGSAITVDVVTEPISFAAESIYDDDFKDNSTDITGQLRISNFALVKEQIWEDMIASLKVTITNATETNFGEPVVLVAMYDTETGEQLSVITTRLSIPSFNEKTVFIDLPLNTAMNNGGKYNNGGYCFKAYIWNNDTKVKALADPATLYIGGGNQ